MKPRRYLGLALLAVAGSSGCREGVSHAPSSTSAKPPVPTPAASSRGGARPASPAQPTLAPLRAEWLERLELEGGSVAYVAPPVGARERRPVLVAVHGAGDRPEWACGGWRLACSAYAFVLCPRGVAVGEGRYGWSSSGNIATQTVHALQALRARFGSHLADAPLSYAGFSQGAILGRGALHVTREPYRSVIYAEGGYADWANPAFATELAGRGTDRMLLVCGSPGCFAHAERAAPVLSKKGVRARVVGDPRAGHNLNERMQRALQSAFPDYVRDQPGWETFR